MVKVSLVLRALNVLSENADPDSLDERLLHTRIISDGQRAGREFRRFLDNGAKVEIAVGNHQIIDCRQASMPEDWRTAGWKVAWHRNLGRQIWTPDAVRLHLAEEQKDGRVVRGDRLRTILEVEPVLTDNWLDFYLQHPEYIPESWKGKVVFFWGTGYRGPDGGLCVRYLCFDAGRWRWHCHWLGHDWFQTFPALLLASS